MDAETVECAVHGASLPAFMCVHLPKGEGQGFYHSDLAPDDEEQSRPDAWCGACEQRRLSTGGHWTEANEPELSLVCATCWDLIGERNFTGHEDD